MVLLLSNFKFNKFVEGMVGPIEQVCKFVESTKKKSKACQMEVKSSLIGIKLLPHFNMTFPLFSKKLDHVEQMWWW